MIKKIIKYNVISFISALFAILGTVLGSGFVSGKEIVVFFSRFGLWSYPAIAIVFVLFYYILKALLSACEWVGKTFKESKFALSLNLIVCTIFSSSMFAGVSDMLGENKLFYCIIMAIVLAVCFVVSKRGISCLDKINLTMVPFMFATLCVMVVKLFCRGSAEIASTSFGGASVFYAVLYVLLNTSNSCLLFAEIGKRFSAKQKARLALVSALVLSVMLAFVNTALLINPQVLGENMPLLALFNGAFGVVVSSAIFVGCLTTLFSLIYGCSSSMRGLCKNEIIIFLISVITPFAISFLGFGVIVQWLYPLVSVLGAILLLAVLFVPLFKRGNKKIHSTRKHTK